MPLLLVLLSALGYAAWNDQLTSTVSLNAGIEDIQIQSATVTEYNGFGYELTWTIDSLYFNDTNIFPGWELNISTEIINKGNIPVKLYYTLLYSQDGGATWTPTDATGLFTNFGLVYTDGFYNATTLEHLTPGEFWLWPNKFVLKIEHLFFDAQDRPELQSQAFLFKVVVESHPG